VPVYARSSERMACGRLSDLLIVNCIPEETGWGPVQHMIVLAAKLLEGEVVAAHPSKLPSATRKTLSILHRRSKRGSGHESCLMICAGPADLLRVLDIAGWRQRFGFLAAWIIDSFWLDHISIATRWSRPFDHIFVTGLEDVHYWNRVTQTPITWLPWGSDVLRLGCSTPEREWDVLRVGRQPPEWEDDIATSAAAQLRGLRYRGRPSYAGKSPVQNYEFLMPIYGTSKHVWAFSNRVNPERYTHPTREYVTARWVDALACGATVAGIPPRGPGVDQLLWPGALLDLGTIRRDAGLDALALASNAWRPESAVKNNIMALRKLDWRWRLKSIADVFGISPQPLTGELTLLKQRIAAASSLP